VTRLQRKSFANATDARIVGRGRFDVVNLDETAVGRIEFKPGWRWSIDAKPKVGGSSCQVRHLGAAVSGVQHILADDGTEMEIHGGEAYEIPPGHDGWVVGNEPAVVVDFQGMLDYAKPQK